MPDWFYRTVSQPVLFSLPAPRARDFALGFIGRLARVPFGSFLIDFLGHMRADPRLRQSLLDTNFPTAVGLGPLLDTKMVALEGLSRFGIGFIEVGPVSLEGSVATRPVRRLREQEALWIDREPGSVSLAECNRRLSNAAAIKISLIVRLNSSSDDDVTARLLRDLSPSVQIVTLSSLAVATILGWSSERWTEHLNAVLNASSVRKLLLCITADQDVDAVAPFVAEALSKGVRGFVIDGSLKADTDGRIIGLPVHEHSLRLVCRLRRLSAPMFR